MDQPIQVHVADEAIQVRVADQLVVVGGGGPGTTGPDPRYFQVTARLAELDTSEAKAAARAALELNIIDCGTF